MSNGFCPQGTCDGSGWILDDENWAQPCACRASRINRTKSRQVGMGVPARFRGLSFDRKPICDLDPEILREVRRYIRNIDRNLEDGRGLWFGGDVGTGKTSLAMLVSQAAIDAGHSVAIYSVPQLLAEIKETFEQDSSRSYMQLFRRLCEVDLLQLDDLGAERRTEWVLEQLYAIVNERWQSKRAIIVTSNLVDREKLREQVTWRTVSRLTEICGQALPIMGADLRVANAPD